MTAKSPDERLRELRKEFEAMLGEHSPTENIVSNEDLLKSLGLTKDEAEAWLRDEPDYKPSDESLQKKSSDKDFTEPKNPQRPQTGQRLNTSSAFNTTPKKPNQHPHTHTDS